MSEKFSGKGKCLCGKVEVTANEIDIKLGACHCSMCRKWGGGGPLFAAECGTQVEFTGKESIGVFNSSDWAERAFCKECGTSLFYRLKGKYLHMLNIGLFDKELPFNFDHQIFIDEKPSYYQFANQTKNMTGEEVFSAYS